MADGIFLEAASPQLTGLTSATGDSPTDTVPKGSEKVPGTWYHQPKRRSPHVAFLKSKWRARLFQPKPGHFRATRCPTCNQVTHPPGREFELACGLSPGSFKHSLILSLISFA